MFFGLSYYDWIVIVAYIAGIRLIFFDQQAAHEHVQKERKKQDASEKDSENSTETDEPAGNKRVRLRRAIIGYVAAAAVMVVFAQFGSLRDGRFDLFCAPIVGAFVGLQIELVLWVERGSSIARYMTASWLLLAVIAGNLLVPSFKSFFQSIV